MFLHMPELDPLLSNDFAVLVTDDEHDALPDMTEDEQYTLIADKLLAGLTAA